jgi:hypothetical protein
LVERKPSRSHPNAGWWISDSRDHKRGWHQPVEA